MKAVSRSRVLARLAAVLLVGTGAFPVADAAAEMVSGRIKSFECGDNCYLTITRKTGGVLTGLCAAAECNAWNDRAAMPADMVGVDVTVMVGLGKQYDAEGKPMGDFPAFTDIMYGN